MTEKIKIEGIKKEVDLDVVFEAISDRQLETEYDSRGLYVEPEADNGNLSDKKATLTYLQDIAFYFRQNDKLDWAIRADNLIEELYL